MKAFFEFLQDMFKGEDIRNERYVEFKVDIAEWQQNHAENLDAFYNTPDGKLFVQHLKKHQMEVNEWACDVSRSDYSAIEYKACIAFGVKLAHQKLLSMSKAKIEEGDFVQDALDKFVKNRLARAN